MELSKVRIQAARKSDWNGELLSQMRSLVSIAPCEGEAGTSIQVKSRATAPNMMTSLYSVPSEWCCISVFRNLRNQLKAPFRITLKGQIVDVQPQDCSTQGNPMRMFDFVDHQGACFKCCAMKHNVTSAAIKNYQEAVIYCATARGPIGSLPALLYLFKDAMIVPFGSCTLLKSPKSEVLEIE